MQRPPTKFELDALQKIKTACESAGLRIVQTEQIHVAALTIQIRDADPDGFGVLAVFVDVTEATFMEGRRRVLAGKVTG